MRWLGLLKKRLSFLAIMGFVLMTATASHAANDGTLVVTTNDDVAALIGGSWSITGGAPWTVGDGATTVATSSAVSVTITFQAVAGYATPVPVVFGLPAPGANTYTATLSTGYQRTIYTVTFDTNTGDGGATAAQNAYYNVSTALTANGFTKTGYTFSGWNTLALGGGTAYANTAAYPFTANVTLYAQWTINSYTVTPSVVNGVITPTIAQTVNYNATTSFTLTDADVGYTTTGTVVTGTCAAGSWVGLVYTTGAVTANCTVIFTLPLGANPGDPGFHGSEVPIVVTILPAQAVTDGAMWSLDGGSTWNASGASVSGPLSFTITFNTQSDTSALAGGWRSPLDISGVTTLGVPVAKTALYRHIANDYDNNGKSDILFRHGTTGKLYEWNMTGANGNTVLNGGFTSVNPGLPGVSPGAIVAQADFDGDGKADILFQDSTTRVLTIWFMNGRTRSSVATVSITPVATEIFAGAGDFYGTGMASMLLIDPKALPGATTTNPLTSRILSFANSAAALAGTATTANIVNSLSAVVNLAQGTAKTHDVHKGWHVAAIADFNGDGKADILWRFANQTASLSPVWAAGQTNIWFMNGNQRVAGPAISPQMGAYYSLGAGTTPLGQLVAGAGDFNGDGHMDIMWRNAVNGKTTVWLMNGTGTGTPTKLADLPNTAVEGDLRGSGKTVNTRGVVLTAGVFTRTAGWHVKGVGDFDGDGKDDVLWRYLGTGHTLVWKMNGRTVGASKYTSVYPGSNATWSSQVMRTVLDPQ